MALIKCPECNNQISDKAYACPKCGYPINQELNKNQNNLYFYDVYFISFSLNNDKKIKTIAYLRNIHNLSLSEVMDIEKKSPCIIFHNINSEQTNKIKETLSNLDCKIEIKKHKEQYTTSDNEKISNYYQNIDTITCPRCGSNQITTGQRGYKFITGFIGSNKTVNRCAKCGYSWKP